MAHGVALVVLANSHIVSGQDLAISMEIYLEGHCVSGVDVETRTVSKISLVVYINREVAISVAFTEVTVLVRLVAGAWRCPETMHVALKECKLRAKSAREASSIAAEVRVALVHGTIFVDGRHGD